MFLSQSQKSCFTLNINQIIYLLDMKHWQFSFKNLPKFLSENNRIYFYIFCICQVTLFSPINLVIEMFFYQKKTAAPTGIVLILHELEYPRGSVCRILVQSQSLYKLQMPIIKKNSALYMEIITLAWN